MKIKGMLCAALLFTTVLGQVWAASAEQEIHQLLNTYARSVNEFNIQPQLAQQIWNTGDETVFIHPKGTEYGWQQIHSNFYEKTMGKVFSKRELTINNDVTIDIHGNTAIVTFSWLFKATVAKDDRQVENRGRETQVLINRGDGWKIQHVHYSGISAG